MLAFIFWVNIIIFFVLKKYLKANKCQKIAQNKLFKTIKVDNSKGQKRTKLFFRTWPSKRNQYYDSWFRIKKKDFFLILCKYLDSLWNFYVISKLLNFYKELLKINDI